MTEDNIHNVATTAIFMAMSHPRGDELNAVLDGWGMGHLELVQELAEYAVLSEQWIMEAKPQDFPGVYDYEVSEPFGEWFTDFVLTSEGNVVPSKAEGTAKLRELFDAFFAGTTQAR